MYVLQFDLCEVCNFSSTRQQGSQQTQTPFIIITTPSDASLADISLKTCIYNIGTEYYELGGLVERNLEYKFLAWLSFCLCYSKPEPNLSVIFMNFLLLNTLLFGCLLLLNILSYSMLAIFRLVLRNIF